jgi:hypothetical protein
MCIIVKISVVVVVVVVDDDKKMTAARNLYLAFGLVAIADEQLKLGK